jgi:hypothetical protein
MPIVDAQIHGWGSGLPSHLAHRQVTAFPAEEAVGLMDAGGVDAAVIHKAGADPFPVVVALAIVGNATLMMLDRGPVTGALQPGAMCQLTPGYSWYTRGAFPT